MNQSPLGAGGTVGVDFQVRVSTWARRTFPHNTPGSVLAHLREEVDEVAEAIQDSRSPTKVADELADCFLLLLSMADLYQVDLIAAAERVHERNVASRFADSGKGYDKRVTE